MSADNISVVNVRNTLMVTVPPDPDDETISVLQDRVLAAMIAHQSRGLIMDISTVETLDSFFARTILETGQMVQLMGGKTVIAGMRVSVAITATQLGLSFGDMRTALDVDRALDMLKEHPGDGGDHGLFV
jgi:rsbT antagonist protein RsbS